jgi:hypothetical protein
MSRKEIDRLNILSKVQDKLLKQTKAAQILGISDRQVRNLICIMKSEGPKGIVSKKRGKESNNKYDDITKSRVFELISQHYSDFAPTLITEKLVEDHNIKISRETVRQWMISWHLWVPKEKKRKIHLLRQRRMHEGELLQADGSHHDWFENGHLCTLIYFIDDATGKITAARFEKGETLVGYFEILQEHLLKHGIPRSMYTDRFSVFESGKKKENLTQFKRALSILDIEWIGANTPQAKGRIERCNRTLQDRLIKEMRLRGIKTIEEGNQFLKEYISKFNKQFSKKPMKEVNLHRPLEGLDLSRILSKYEERTLTKDLLFQFHNTYYKILEPLKEYRRGKVVEIRRDREEKIRVFDGDKELIVKSLAEIFDEEEVQLTEEIWPKKYHPFPRKDHPWRKNQDVRRRKMKKRIGV